MKKKLIILLSLITLFINAQFTEYGDRNFTSSNLVDSLNLKFEIDTIKLESTKPVVIDNLVITGASIDTIDTIPIFNTEKLVIINNNGDEKATLKRDINGFEINSDNAINLNTPSLLMKSEVYNKYDGKVLTLGKNSLITASDLNIQYKEQDTTDIRAQSVLKDASTEIARFVLTEDHIKPTFQWDIFNVENTSSINDLEVFINLSFFGGPYTLVDMSLLHVIRPGETEKISGFITSDSTYLTGVTARLTVFFSEAGNITDSVNFSIKSYNPITQPFDSLDFKLTTSGPNDGKLFYDYVTKLMAYYVRNQSNPNYLNVSAITPFVNTDSDTIYSGTPLSVKDTLALFGTTPLVTVTGALGNSGALADLFIGVADGDVPPDSVGIASRFDFITGDRINAKLQEFNVGDKVWCSDNTATLTNIEPHAPNHSLYVGVVFLAPDLTTRVLGVNSSNTSGSDTDINWQGGLNGIITQKQGIYDSIIDGVLNFYTYNEENPSINLPFMFALDHYDLNTIANTGVNGWAYVPLSYGTASEAQNNYIYIDNTTTPTLTVNTTGFPDSGIKLAQCGVYDQANHETYSFDYIQRFNNAVNGSDAMGVLARTVDNIRNGGSKYGRVGIEPTVTIITSGGLDSLKVSTTAGINYQFNKQIAGAQNGYLYKWGNNPNVTGGQTWITDLAEINVDALGNSLRGNNTRYGLNLFFVQNSGAYGGYILVMAPNGEYSSDLTAVNDASGYAVTSPPANQSQVVVRICRVVVNYSNQGGGSITNLLGAGGYQDERGFPLGTSGGSSSSGGGATYPVSDATISINNNTDPTKIGNFDLSNLSTGTTRTLIYADRDIDMNTLTDYNNVVDIVQDSTFTGIRLDTAFFYDNETSGYFYPGITDPTNSTRLNYQGYLHATAIYADAGLVDVGNILQIGVSGITMTPTNTGSFSIDVASNTIPNFRPHKLGFRNGIGGTQNTIAIIADTNNVTVFHKDSTVFNKPVYIDTIYWSSGDTSVGNSGSGGSGQDNRDYTAIQFNDEISFNTGYQVVDYGAVNVDDVGALTPTIGRNYNSCFLTIVGNGSKWPDFSAYDTSESKYVYNPNDSVGNFFGFKQWVIPGDTTIYCNIFSQKKVVLNFDSLAPIILSANIYASDSSMIILKASKVLEPDSLSLSAWTINTTRSISPDNILISNDTVFLDADVAFIDSDTVTLDYTSTVSPSMEDLSGTKVVSFTNYSVNNNLNPAEDSLLLYLPFDGNTDDESGNNFTITNNGATLTTDQDGNSNSAYEFNGTTDFMDMVDVLDSLYNFTNRLTFACWAKRDVISITQSFFALSVENVDYFAFRYKPANTVAVSVNESPDVAEITTDGTFTDIVNWHHYAMTYDGDTYKVYVDGALEATTITNPPVWDWSTLTMTDALLGAFEWVGGDIQHWDGKLDQIRIYQKPLSEVEITTLFNNKE